MKKFSQRKETLRNILTAHKSHKRNNVKITAHIRIDSELLSKNVQLSVHCTVFVRFPQQVYVYKNIGGSLWQW